MSQRLPPQVAWPLKAAQIDSALGDRAPDVRLVRTTWKKEPSNTPLSIDWHATRPALKGSEIGEGPTLWIRPISRPSRSAVSELLVREALPDLVQWLERAYAASETWQAMHHQRHWRLQGTGLAFAETDGIVHILNAERGGRDRALSWTPLGEA